LGATLAANPLYEPRIGADHPDGRTDAAASNLRNVGSSPILSTSAAGVTWWCGVMERIWRCDEHSGVCAGAYGRILIGRGANLTPNILATILPCVLYVLCSEVYQPISWSINQSINRSIDFYCITKILQWHNGYKQS